MVAQARKAELIKKFARSSNDTGSTEVQIAILADRINQISAHLKSFPKDNHSRRGLQMLVGQRRSFEKYLERTDRKRLVALKAKMSA